MKNKEYLQDKIQTEDLDTYDSDCYDVSNAKAVLIANISNYGSDVISEAPHSETYLNDIENQSVHAMQDFKQTPIVDVTDNEITKAHKEPPKVSLVNESLKRFKLHLANFDKVMKIRTTPNARTEDLLNEIIEVQTAFDQMEVVVQQCLVDKQCSEIANKELFLENDRLLQQIMSQDVLLIVMNMFKLDFDPLTPKLFQNREAHIDYLKYTQEQADILRGIVKQAKAKQPLDTTLDFACNKRNDRISQTPSRNMKNKVEAQPRKVNKKNNVVEPFRDVDVKQSHLNANSELICATCSSKQAKIIESKNANHSKPNNAWGYNATDIPSSSSLVMTGTVRFGNDHIARIIGYGDYQLGNVTISRVYYVEGLGHNLFSVGQFCNTDLEVTFQKNTCFIHNLEGVDLLSGSRDTNLYTISLDDMLKTYTICLLSKASKTKSLLWHRRLLHLNFGTLNKLAKDGLTR
nr:retrovirus-related Pol polyprotein from transposon TNT 1-94 [Tanacetum cinerariifolium]